MYRKRDYVEAKDPWSLEVKLTESCIPQVAVVPSFAADVPILHNDKPTIPSGGCTDPVHRSLRVLTELRLPAHADEGAPQFLVIPLSSLLGLKGGGLRRSK